jgi:hypothetical protein
VVDLYDEIIKAIVAREPIAFMVAIPSHRPVVVAA